MHSWLILLGIGFSVWLFTLRRGGPMAQGGIFSFGRSRAREVTGATVTFDRVAGVDEAKEELQEVVDFLKRPGAYAEIGARIPRGVLLVGPPGTGKTLLGRAVAGEAGVPFFQVSGSEFVELIVGIGAARMRDTFRRARRSSPSIIFIDELDALGKARAGGAISHEEREQTLNQLLVEMDGFDNKTGVIVMAATNRPEILDSALLRAGRFDRQILVDRPEKQGRKQILEIHTRDLTKDEDVDLDSVAARTTAFAGADLANLANEAALLAARNNKRSVGMPEFDEALERIMMGLEKKGRLLSPQEQRIVAFHELGHAVVAEALPNADSVNKVTIVPRGMGLGATWHQPREERYLRTASELHDQIAVLLGGRAAELLFIGEASTGAQDDLAKATDIAADMVRKYGMSSLGTRAFDRARAAFVNTDVVVSTPREHGDELADLIDREVDRIIQEALQRATEVLKERKSAVESLAEQLLEVQTLRGSEIRAALAARHGSAKHEAGSPRQP